MSGSVSTRTANRQAERVTASGQLRLPSCCGALPAKSSSSRSPSSDRAQAQQRGRPRGASSTSSASQLAVGQRGQAGARAPLGVVEHGVGRLAQALGAEARGELARGAARRCGWRPAARAGRRGARPAGASARRAPRSRARRAAAARSRRPPPRSGGCRRASSRARAPPTSAWWARLAAKPISAPAGEHRRDHGDVGQVRAAGERVVEDPRDARRDGARRAPPPRPRASRRGAPGCARPASPSRPSASNSAVEASRRSLMFDECAERISTAPISSQAARSAPVSDLQLDRVERRAHRCQRPPLALLRCIVPWLRRPRPTSRAGQQGRLRQRAQAWPRQRAAGRELAAQHARVGRLAPSKQDRALARAARAAGPAPGRRRAAAASCAPHRHAHR